MANDDKPAYLILIYSLAGYIPFWIVICRNKNIDMLEKLNGYNFPIRQRLIPLAVSSQINNVFSLYPMDIRTSDLMDVQVALNK